MRWNTRHVRAGARSLPLLVTALALLIAASAWALTALTDVGPFAPGVGGPTTLWAAERPAGDEQPLLRLAVAGDVGTGGYAELRTSASIAHSARGRPFDALLLLGDNVYPHGDPALLPQTVFNPFAPVLDAGTRLLPVLGNHDVAAGHGDLQARALGMPGRWYAVRLGDMLVVALDSSSSGEPEQSAWLQRTLESSDARWIIAMLHHPPFSGGRHGSDLDAREAFAALFARYGVQLVLAGHEHDYQRSKPIEGVTYVVSGAAAKTRPTGRAEFTETAWSVLHWVEIEVWPDRLELRAITQDGLVFDRATIEGPRGTAASR